MVRGITRRMRLYVPLLVAGLPVRPGLALLAERPGLFDPGHYYNLARNLAEGRGFDVDCICQYHQRPTDVTHSIDYGMFLAAVWPHCVGSEGDGRLPLPGRSSYSRLCGIVET